MYARYKLKELEFFWEKAKEATIRTDEHVFYFSAFLSAFRSLTFVLQSQYKKTPGFARQYDRVLAYLGTNPLFSSMKEARNIVLKEGAHAPLLITKCRNKDTDDVISYECDPLPESEDVIRKTTVDMGFRQEWLISSDIPAKERQKIYLSQLLQVMEGFSTGNIEIEQFIRMDPDGEAIPLNELTEPIEKAIEFFREILPEFELHDNEVGRA